MYTTSITANEQFAADRRAAFRAAASKRRLGRRSRASDPGSDDVVA
jgi:hypothetical protein